MVHQNNAEILESCLTHHINTVQSKHAGYHDNNED